ncbi:hypothetical protein V2H45_20185 [Tumidithrix elongata RA019]|uniref:Uncharacterized protein n=1 Tax=Tumidithrix elongata BACA0141 TaxID=2716417 RepID=A0AAW9PX57_9CYAN|nr:hypothetical protein [Tumidithrix elongata RA019]
MRKSNPHPSQIQPNMEKVGYWLNKALVFDLFLVFFFFAWFMVALIGNSFHFNLGLDLWQQLWQPVIQPVLGIMMAGAIASGIISKLKSLAKTEN